MMNTQFYKTGLFILAGLVFMVVTGCSKDMDDKVSILGEWIEESPVESRTELYFYSANRVTLTNTDGSEDYVYRIMGNSIYLRADETGDGGEESELFFRQISENSFQIENLYVSIPEDEPIYMIFRRKGSEGDMDPEEAPSE